MSRSNPAILFGFFMAIIVAMCGPALLKGGLFIGKHEGDTYHLLQVVFRMADGEWPHLDFMTPIGALSFAPIALFVKLGYGVGTAIILAQALVAIVFLPAVWWAAFSRLKGWLPYLFGLIIMVLITALVHGEAQSSVSISMHYNRWAWAAAFVAIIIAVLPNRGRKRPTIDGLIIGLALSALVLLKMTYFVAFLMPISLAMILHKNYGALCVAMITGLIVVSVITVFSGLGFWQAYLVDLLTVAGSETRPNPGEPFGIVLGGPAYLSGSLAIMFGVVLLRQSGEMIAGLILLLLVPSFFYVTYQNFANDPQWLMLLGVFLLAFDPNPDLKNGLGWNMQNGLRIVGAVTLALTAPSFFNLAYSPFRHFNTDVTEYAPLLPHAEQHGDLQAATSRMMHVTSAMINDGPNSPFARYSELYEAEEPTVFQGEVLPRCKLNNGWTAVFQSVVDDLESVGLADGKRLFAADLFSSYWLFGSLEPLEQGAPWHYGGLPGIESADYVLILLCPISLTSRQQILEEIEEAGIELTEIRRTSVYILFSQKAAGG